MHFILVLTAKLGYIINEERGRERERGRGKKERPKENRILNLNPTQHKSLNPPLRASRDPTVILKVARLHTLHYSHNVASLLRPPRRNDGIRKQTSADG